MKLVLRDSSGEVVAGVKHLSGGSGDGSGAVVVLVMVALVMVAV